MARQNNWEFLLQQEGDRSWLPLESPDVEILEGRYRVMAKTAMLDTLMEIRITHESTHEFPIKRRTQIRSGESNAMGLLLVIPFTQMQPGIWELAIKVQHAGTRKVVRGGPQQYSVQLHVLPKESDVAGEWEPDWSQPHPEPELQLPQTSFLEPEFLEVREPIIAEIIAPEPIGIAPPAPLIDRQTVTLSLQPNSYDIQAGQTIAIVGIVQATIPGSLSGCTLVIRVRDPQRGDLVVERSTPYPLITLPFQLELGLTIPATLPGSMLMGDLCLMDDRTGETLAVDRFTLFAPLSDVLATIQDLTLQTRAPTVDQLPHPPAEAPGPEFDDQFLGLVNQPANAQASFQVSPKSQIPPKLYSPDPNRDDRPALSLPTFPTAPTPKAEVENLSESLVVDDPVMGKLSFDDLTQPEDFFVADVPTVPEASNQDVYSSEDGLEAAFLDSDLDDNLDLNQSEFVFNTTAPLDLDDPDDMRTIDINAQHIPDRSAQDDRFESLNLADRFMDRMSAFAEDTQMEAVNAIPPAPPASVNPFASTRASSSESVVILDDGAFNSVPTALDTGDNPLLIGADELVPTPSLDLEAVDEVVAGQSLKVRVKLPMIQPKLYVKLWINDRQTRTLLDGPRYLVDFVPDAQYCAMEAITTFTVPLGSLEIQIEAIAIETATKREGYKVSAALVVVPPNLPKLDDFEF